MEAAMRNSTRMMRLMVGGVMLLGIPSLGAQDWPQWRGPNRDARATGFKAPKTWPAKLTKGWTVKVGTGVASPALVDDRLYVFTREGGDEVIRCLKATSGEEVWQDKYAAPFQKGPDSRFDGPRASPAVADGKVVTLGVNGVLSCDAAADGKKLWRTDKIKGWPKFHTSSSPIIEDGMCIAQLGGTKGGAKGGGVAAYDLATGNEKWKWMGDSPGYASPVLLTVDGTRAIIAETVTKIVAVAVTDGKLLWETPFSLQYNSSTPLVDGQTLIYCGMREAGTTTVKLEKKDGMLVGTPKWHNEIGAQYNTPVLLDGMLYGISDRDSLFCINAETGKTAWTSPLPKAAGGGGGKGGRGKGGRGMGGGGGYGSIVGAGNVLISLTPQGQLVFFQPSDKGFKQLAAYKVAEGGTYAYPIVSGNRVFTKDAESLTLWTIE
jgi:outer membrane protein assembly factor BamB